MIGPYNYAHTHTHAHTHTSKRMRDNCGRGYLLLGKWTTDKQLANSNGRGHDSPLDKITIAHTHAQAHDYANEWPGSL